NNRFLWTDPLDDFSDIFAPGALAQIPSDPATYLKNLTPAKAAARIGTGLLATFAHLGEALGPMGNGEGSAPLTVVLGIVLLLVALVSVVRAPKSDLRSLTIAHAGVFFAFFWFYAVVTSDPRFVFPAALALLPFAVRTPVEPGSEPLALPRPLAHWMSRLLPTAFGLAVLLSLVTSPLSNSPPPGFRAAQDFLVAHVRPGEDLAVDGRTLLEPTWLFAPGSKMHILSSTFRGQSVPEEVMLQELRAQHVRWVLIDRAAVDDGKPRWLFHDRLQLLPDGSLPETNLPQGLTLAYADSTLPRSWLVLEVH
ncbi:MAG: hypothetical protein JST92_26615, partial [Deltaproteobacteria bacterium]|nr:hypothetical protein [Deltaproteobacteria bacterium]